MTVSTVLLCVIGAALALFALALSFFIGLSCGECAQSVRIRLLSDCDVFLSFDTMPSADAMEKALDSAARLSDLFKKSQTNEAQASRRSP